MQMQKRVYFYSEHRSSRVRMTESCAKKVTTKNLFTLNTATRAHYGANMGVNFSFLVIKTCNTSFNKFVFVQNNDHNHYGNSKALKIRT